MEIKQLTKVIGEATLFTDISFTLLPGEITGLVGRNGAGKTSLFRTIAQDYQATKGEVTIDGVNLMQDGGARSQVFYLDEKMKHFRRFALDQIGAEYAAFFDRFDRTTYESLLERYHFKKEERYLTCSKGRQRLLDFILAIASNATYILLDEPFDGLDLLIRKQVIQLLLDHVADKQVGVLIASHNIQELETLIERVVFIKNGKMIDDCYLDSEKNTVKKYQFVFRDKKIPAIVKAKGKIIAIQGRVVICLFEQFTPELRAAIEVHQPVLLEELPVRLEDIYMQHFTKEKDYQLFQ